MKSSCNSLDADVSLRASHGLILQEVRPTVECRGEQEDDHTGFGTSGVGRGAWGSLPLGLKVSSHGLLQGQHGRPEHGSLLPAHSLLHGSSKSGLTRPHHTLQVERSHHFETFPSLESRVLSGPGSPSSLIWGCPNQTAQLAERALGAAL